MQLTHCVTCSCSATADRGRFSFLGGRGGPLWRKLTYRLPPSASQHNQPAAAGAASTSAAAADASGLHDAQPMAADGGAAASNGPHHQAVQGTLVVEDAQGHEVTLTTSFFDHMEQLLGSYHLDVRSTLASQLPFNFWGGLVGYLGYELKAECGGCNAHASPTPDAAMYFADRLVVVDHQESDVYVVALYVSHAPSGSQSDAAVTASANGSDAQIWVEQMVGKVEGLAQRSTGPTDAAAVTAVTAPAVTAQPHANGSSTNHSRGVNGTGHLAQSDTPTVACVSQPPPFRLAHNKQQYIENVEHCRRWVIPFRCCWFTCINTV